MPLKSLLPAKLTQNRRLIPLAFSILLGLAGVFLMNQVLQQERRKLNAERDKMFADYRSPVEVLVALSDLPEGTTIAKEHLGIMQVPEKFLQPYWTRDPALLIGRVTRAPIAEKEQVLTNKVRAPEERPKGNQLSDLMPEGKRAVTFGVDMVGGVGGFVRPGDKVDILWSFSMPGRPGSGGTTSPNEPVTLTLFQDVTIMALNGQVMGRGAAAPSGGGPEAAGGQMLITVALAPKEAALLLVAREQGQLQLSLRSPKDAGQQLAAQPANVDAVMQMLFGDQVETAAPPPSSRPVEVYKGLQREIVTVEVK